MNHFTYKPAGVCSRMIDIDVEGNTIVKVTFTGGCSGNTKGVTALLIGMTVEEAIKRLEGIRCGAKSTSCPDQLACALKQFQAENA